MTFPISFVEKYPRRRPKIFGENFCTSLPASPAFRFRPNTLQMPRHSPKTRCLPPDPSLRFSPKTCQMPQNESHP